MHTLAELLSKSEVALDRGAGILAVHRKMADENLRPDVSAAILAKAQACIDLGTGYATLAMARIQNR